MRATAGLVLIGAIFAASLSPAPGAPGQEGGEAGERPRLRYSVTEPLNIPNLKRRGLVTVRGLTPATGTLLDAFDGSSRTAFRSEAGEAVIELWFVGRQRIERIRLELSKGGYRWSLSGSERPPVLGAMPDLRDLVPERRSAGKKDEVAVRDAPEVRFLRLRVSPEGAVGRVEVRELELVGEQIMEGIGVDSPTTMIPLGTQVPLEVLGLFSGGHVRRIRDEAIRWDVRPELLATVLQHHRIVGRRRGPFRVIAHYGGFVSPPLRLEVGEPIGSGFGIGF
jgi:hypothetical protein